MKKLFTQIVKKNGELKDVYVCVDDETARVLEQVDEETRHTYLQEEYKMFMADYRYKRRNQSLERSVDNGFDVIDEKQDVEEMAIKEADMQRILEAIKTLNDEQQWLVKQVYVYGRKKLEIAAELGIDNSSVRDRFRVIFKKIKKFLKN